MAVSKINSPAAPPPGNTNGAAAPLERSAGAGEEQPAAPLRRKPRALEPSARARRPSGAGEPATRSRSGLGEATDFIEVWTDEAEARARGLFRILDEEGRVHAGAEALVPELSPEQLRRMYRGMLTIRTLDERLLPMQRQGRIGFYIECRGQEAGVIGGAEAIGPDDWFVPGLRETGAAVYRGLPLRTHMAQIFGNAHDIARGRQLPCHSGSRASHHIVMSSCVSSQLPHAVGLAWAAKLRRQPHVALGYLGDGGTSEEDFHVALNFAGVYQAPVVFVCQNNQWAISTPLALQTASETLALKGLAYGVPSVRVDGNDVLAVYATVKAAVDKARAGGGPTFIECLTYRLGPHSSSDDPSRYRDEKEAEAYKHKEPLRRFGAYLAGRGVLSAPAAQELAAEVEREIREAIAAEEAVGPPPLRSLIEDVTAEPSWILEEQLAELERARQRRRG